MDVQTECWEINEVRLSSNNNKIGFYKTKHFVFWHFVTSWNNPIYSQLLCLLLLGTTINSNYTPKTHSKMKLSCCSSLLMSVHASKVAGSNSEDTLEVTQPKSWYFQPFSKAVLRFQGSEKPARAGEVAPVGSISSPMQAQRAWSDRNLIQRHVQECLVLLPLIQKGNTELSTPLACSYRSLQHLGKNSSSSLPRPAITHTVIAQEHYMKWSLRKNAAFLLNNEKEGSKDFIFLTNHKLEEKNNLWEHTVAYRGQ